METDLDISNDAMYRGAYTALAVEAAAAIDNLTTLAAGRMETIRTQWDRLGDTRTDPEYQHLAGMIANATLLMANVCRSEYYDSDVAAAITTVLTNGGGQTVAPEPARKPADPVDLAAARAAKGALL